MNRIGAIAEAQNHHPDLGLAWGRVGVRSGPTRSAGSTESDFIFAAKCDRAFADLHAAMMR